METHTALAVPDEDDCITVYSSNHSPEVLHDTLSAALGIPMHNIRVITRRLGGSFGGKNTRSLIVSVLLSDTLISGDCFLVWPF